jgi:hypothetical protein
MIRNTERISSMQNSPSRRPLAADAWACRPRREAGDDDVQQHHQLRRWLDSASLKSWQVASAKPAIRPPGLAASLPHYHCSGSLGFWIKPNKTSLTAPSTSSLFHI